MPEVWYWVNQSHCSSDGIMRDICDGFHMQEILKNGIFLEIILYLDDIEIVNPIGSHVKKHKVTMIYFSIANIFRLNFVPSLKELSCLPLSKPLMLRALGCKIF